MKRRLLFHLSTLLMLLATWLVAAGAEAQIRVAVEDGSVNGTGPAIVTQLNNDTFFNFTATVVNAAAIDTAGELANYDVVILGDSGNNNNDHTQAMADAILAAAQAGTIGVVTVGWIDYSTTTIGPDATLDLVMPIDASPYSYDFCNASSTINIANPNAHPVTFGLPTSFVTTANNVEYNNQAVDATNAQVLGTVSGTCNAAVPRQTIVTGRNGPGRLVYLGLLYMANTGYNNADLRTGNADRLLEQAVAWASQSGAIRVAVEDGSVNGTGPAIVTQLNDDTYFDFAATLVNAAAVDTAGELTNYDVVVFGDSGNNNNDHSLAMANAWVAAVTAGTLGVVSVGWADYSTTTVVPDSTLDDVMPTDASPYSYDFCNANATINIASPNNHPVTAGLPTSYTTTSNNVEYNNQVPDSMNALVLGTASGTCNAAVPRQTIVVGNNGPGRLVYLGPIYMANTTYNNGDLRSGNHDRLLEQAIAWAMPLAALPPQICGNGIITGSETCDDGNTTPNDGCSATCTVETGWTCMGQPSICTPICGNGQLHGMEACDDANLTPGDGCSATCTVETGWTCMGQPSICTPICGNGQLHGMEACDDGNLTPGDGCSATCTVENGYTCMGQPSICMSTCGDGLVASNEPCDDGNLMGGDGCSATCTVENGYTCGGQPSVCTSTCGDGLIAVGDRDCDDGNTTNGDGCSAGCTLEPGWMCTGQPSVCTTTCGDGIVAGMEQCDDGNTTAMDGCDATCMTEAGWMCMGDPSVCTTTCGDNIVAGMEECDDGNTTSGDGCDNMCNNEGAGGAGGTGGSGMGGSGAATGPAGPGSGSTGSGGDLATDEGGCGCRTVGGDDSSRYGFAALSLLGLALARRRRRAA